MGFSIYYATPSAAVATGGTIAFALGNASNLGQVKFEGGHVLYARGLQAQFAFPNDFTVAYSGSTATVTYNGTTAIPAGTLVELQLEQPGENSYLTIGGSLVSDTLKDSLGNVRAVNARLQRVLFGAIAASSATAVLNAAARAGTVKNVYTTPVVLDVPRGLTVKSSTTDTTQTVIVFGIDEYGVAMSETFALNGTTPVNGKKAFKTIVADQNNIAMAGNLSIGTTNGVIGLPFFLPGGTSAGIGYVLKEIQDGAVATAGAFFGGDLTKATATTGDVRGTWNPNSAPDGAKVYEVVIFGSDITFKGVPQFTA
jgi:hypothetical protein